MWGEGLGKTLGKQKGRNIELPLKSLAYRQARTEFCLGQSVVRYVSRITSREMSNTTPVLVLIRTYRPGLKIGPGFSECNIRSVFFQP